ncbi:MAG: YadA-like family protein, partial [Veillonella sp.]|nr:YadA-like family protein [Veillonella sp.]
ETNVSGTGVATKDKDGNETNVNGTGVATKDKNGNETKVDGTGVAAQDKDGNETKLDSNGFTAKDNAGNKTEVDASGVAVTGKDGKVTVGETTIIKDGQVSVGGTTVTNAGVTVGNTSVKNGAVTVGNTSVTDGQITGITKVENPTDAANKAYVDGAVGQVDKRVDRAGANAAALAGLKPIQYDPMEPTQVMAAVGGFHGESAVALGVAHYTNESTMFHAGVSLDSEETMYNVGLTKKFGSSAAKKAIPERYQGGPISSVYVLQDEVTALKAENAQLKAANEETNAKLAAIMAKLGL